MRDRVNKDYPRRAGCPHAGSNECCTEDGKPGFEKMKHFMEHCGKQQFSEDELVMTESKPPGTAMAMCPMAKMCMGLTEKRPSGLLLMLPGVLLIVVGVLIVIEPRILVWLMGFIRRMSAQLRM
jgi:hypothetical protein